MSLKLKSVVLFFKIVTCFLLPRPCGNYQLSEKLVAALFGGQASNKMDQVNIKSLLIRTPVKNSKHKEQFN